MSPVAEPNSLPKKTRRRLRVSCVECTRRRQKCDRQQPCGLCKTRGVENLCRWESEPYARPPPARPPGVRMVKKETPQQNQVQTYMNWKRDVPSLTIAPFSSLMYSSVKSRASLSPIPTPLSFTQEMREKAIALTRMSIAAAEGEYLGSESLVGQLQKLAISPTDVESSLGPHSGFPFFRGSHSTNVYTSLTSHGSSYPSFMPMLPDKMRCNDLLMGYFDNENWSIGLPSSVIYSVHEGMWQDIQSDPTCINRLDLGWTALFFIIAALSPICANEQESLAFFEQSKAARRLTEDLPVSSSYPLRSALFTCASAALSGKYLMDRGRMTEAWKLVGHGLRDAQNAGLHKFFHDKRLKELSEDEQALVLTTWHLGIEADWFLSLVLGRPSLIRDGDYDVPAPRAASFVLAEDGTTETPRLFQSCLLSLLEVVNTVREKLLKPRPDIEDPLEYFRFKINDWLGNIPSYYDCCGHPETKYDNLYPKLYLQRIMLRGFYNGCCMLFLRSAATRPSQDDSQNGYDSEMTDHYETLAFHATHVLHTIRELLDCMWWQRQLTFVIHFLMFEAAVTICIVLMRDATNSKAELWLQELASAITVFENVQGRDFGQVITQGVKALKTLQTMILKSRQAFLSNLDSTPVSAQPPPFSPAEVNGLFETPGMQAMHGNGHGHNGHNFTYPEFAAINGLTSLYTFEDPHATSPLWSNTNNGVQMNMEPPHPQIARDRGFGLAFNIQ